MLSSYIQAAERLTNQALVGLQAEKKPDSETAVDEEDSLYPPFNSEAHRGFGPLRIAEQLKKKREDRAQREEAEQLASAVEATHLTGGLGGRQG